MLRKSVMAAIAAFALSVPATADESGINLLYSAESTSERDAAAENLRAHAGNTNVQMALGAHRAFSALEVFSQQLYRYGFKTPGLIFIPLMRMPVPENSNPEELTYEAWRQVLQELDSGLGEAVELLAALPEDSEPSLVIDLRSLRFDMNSDGKLDVTESVGAIFQAISRPGRGAGTADRPDPVFRFDRADAYWFQGYANFLRANLKMWLAHDFSTTFDTSFQLFFPGSALNAAYPPGPPNPASWDSTFDLVSFIHTLNWPVADAGMRAESRKHLLEMIRLSRLNWKAILAETDNDREWLPGPQQRAPHPLTTLTITEDTVNGWRSTLVLFEDVLEGRSLIPHPRFPGYGIDMKRFFTEPQDFDLVMSITGPGVVPYLAKGTVLDEKAWEAATGRLGRNNFMLYAVWIN